MNKNLYLCFIFLSYFQLHSQNCVITASASKDTIVCGQNIFLSAYGIGQGTLLLSENFNGGSFGTGWSATTQAVWNNPCSAYGIDSTIHLWMDSSSPVPRTLVTTSFDLSGCTIAGANICFDMLFAEQGNDAPCEGPDEPEEGVYVQYSLNNDTAWTTIHYFDPNGGNDPLLVNWRNWCFEIPAAALTDSTRFRWYQDSDSGAEYDHWGIDNVSIYCNDPNYNIVWTHDGYNAGYAGGVNPNAVAPHATTNYEVVMSNGTDTCKDTLQVAVLNPSLTVIAGTDTIVCTGQCVQLTALAEVIQHPEQTHTYSNFQNDTALASAFGGNFFQGTELNVNVTTLNMDTLLPGSIVSVCIDKIQMMGSGITAANLQFYLLSPDSTTIILMPDSTAVGNLVPGTYSTLFNQTCFVPAAANISSGTPPYTGSYQTYQSFDSLIGCSANGVWKLAILPQSGMGFTTLVTTGWSITFNDRKVSYIGNFIWSPTTSMIDSNTLSPTVCASGNSTYTLTLSDTAGCVTATDTINVSTQLCTGVTETSTAKFSISPNPSTTTISISVPENLIGETAVVTDITGKQMAAVQLQTVNSTLKTAAWSSGIYLVCVGNAVRKLIVQR